jgi:proteasome lid subunit RPN8/RPN11
MPVALRLGLEHIEHIRRQGAREYPAECCGVLVGVEEDAVKVVREAVAIRNLRHERALAEVSLPLTAPERESERNRFLIDREEVRQAEARARSRGLDIVGYYHSHPDHPAQPSDYDREHAWPWLSYVIIRVAAGRACEYSSWVLAEDRLSFEEEAIEVVNVEPRETSSATARSESRHPSPQGD